MTLFSKSVSEGRIVEVLAMSFGKGRIVIGPAGAFYYDDGWCFETADAAIAEARRWDPDVEAEPTGWFRHPETGRRRPNGDATREHVYR